MIGVVRTVDSSVRCFADRVAPGAFNPRFGPESVSTVAIDRRAGGGLSYTLPVDIGAVIAVLDRRRHTHPCRQREFASHYAQQRDLMRVSRHARPTHAHH